MSLKQSILSAFRVMNFITAERAWSSVSSNADFKIAAKPPEGDILIIAPHPDDEIFGCSGAMLLAEKDQKIQIAYIFSGNKSSKSINSREEEAKEAVRLLTNPEQIFFRQSDNSTVGNNTIGELSQLAKTSSNIFVPSFSDPNIDHRESVRAVIKALKIIQVGGTDLAKISIWLYEIWNPLPYFNRLLEFEWAHKQKAMEKFASQLKGRNYIRAIKSLNEYRGEMYGLTGPAEAFFALPADLLVKLFKDEKWV